MRSRTTQREKILRLLQQREGQWVPLYEIVPLAAQYNTRIKELRDAGYRIENRVEHRSGAVYSWFRLAPPKIQPKLFEEPQEVTATICARVVERNAKRPGTRGRHGCLPPPGFSHERERLCPVEGARSRGWLSSMIETGDGSE